MDGLVMGVKKLIEDLQKETKLKPSKIEGSYLELVIFFPLRPITTKIQYDAALKITERLLGLNDDGVKIYLQTLANLIADYEIKTFGTSKVSGSEMLAYLMELNGHTQKDVAQELGGQPNVSKILNGERELNLRQIRKLAAKYKVDPSVFI